MPKTLGDLCDQNQRMFRAAMRRGTRLAALADPATGGNECMAQNWGNAAARDAWRRTWHLWRTIDAAYLNRTHNPQPQESSEAMSNYGNRWQAGDRVAVFKYGSWYRGRVVKVGTSRVFVEYTPRNGNTKTLAFPAEGYGSPRSADTTEYRSAIATHD